MNSTTSGLRTLAAFCLLSSASAAARAEFRIAPGSIAACAGTFTDSGGPGGDYGNGELIFQTLWPGLPGTRVVVSFASFASEAGVDSLYVYNGAHALGLVLRDLTGSPGPVTVASTAADGSLTFVWSSNGSVTASGWVATIACVPLEQRMRNAVVGACEGRFTDSGGDGAYGNGESSVLTLVGISFGALPEVRFDDFDLESGFDVLNVYDGLTTSAPLLATLTGGSLPPTMRATNSDWALTFEFSSDGSVVGRGWSAQILCSNRVSAPTVDRCRGVVTDSGGAGSVYGNLEHYVQTLSPTEPGTQIELEFLSFETEDGFDSLTIYDGNSTSAPSLGTFDGTNSPGVLTSTAGDGTLTLEFDSDLSVVAAGWEAFFTCVRPVTSATLSTCGSKLVDTGGSGGPYQDNETLVETFYPSRPWAELLVHFPTFDSEPIWDVLRIRDGAAGAPELGALDGLLVVPVSFVTTNAGGRLTLDWHSDSSIVRDGWQAFVACVPPLFADGF